MIERLLVAALTIVYFPIVLVRQHMQRSRARVMSMYLNPGYATALCSPSRNGVLTDVYEDWRKNSEAAWNERAKMVTGLRECLDIPSWDGVAVEAKSLLIPVPNTEARPRLVIDYSDPIPAPSIFTIQEVKDDTQHSFDDSD